MKNLIPLFLIIAAVGLTGCRPVSQHPTETGAITPTRAIATTSSAPIAPYQDVRQTNLSDLSGKLDRSLIETLWFNDTTVWPEEYKAVVREILEQGKNPGLGIRKLHDQGITGKGVNVAIIDQNLVAVLDHPEYHSKIVKYFDVGTGQPSDQGSMHGPGVASLLVGENIGTAPGANLYFVAAPSWTADAQFQADALNWIIDENEKLPEGGKIRVVSISAAPSGPGSPFTKNNAAWDTAVARAEAAGILVLDCTTNRGITAPCHYDLDDPDNVAKCIPGWPGMPNTPAPGRIYIPTSFRTTAEEYKQGAVSYQYTGRAGLSWSIPYLAGVLALGWQVNPDLTGADILKIVFDTAYVAAGGEKVIDPGAFIEGVKKAGNP